ncbi:unnamed protein product [Rotaria socialis]|uniref:Uncharacterized protein n=1 Tax=Rotaria socialis TaxID=392032 RepID=A0A821I441_9BILA|nr:unnamed protein product [Rotaria socialis]
MLFFVVVCVLLVRVNSAPEYNSLSDLINKEYYLKNTITTTIATITTTTITFTKNEIEQTKRVADSINKSTVKMEILLPPILVFICTFLTILCRFLEKFHMNNNQCKAAWLFCKTPSEYRRRREAVQRREIALNQLIQQSTPTIYSIA